MPELFRGTPDPNRESNPVRSPEISKRLIEQLFTSSDFEATFKKAFDLVGKHGREHGFSMLNELGTDQVIITKPAGGGAENETRLGIEQKEVIESKKFKGKILLVLSTLHFHNTFPNQDEILFPSREDLSRAIGGERRYNIFKAGFDIPPIQIIALRTSNNNTRLLVFRESLARSLSPEMLDDLELSLVEAQTNKDSQKEIVKLLEDYGHKVVFIPNFSGKFSEKDLELLKLFAFTPNRKKDKEVDIKVAMKAYKDYMINLKEGNIGDDDDTPNSEE